MTPVSPSMVGQVVDSVFADPVYERSVRASLLAQLYAWGSQLYDRLMRAIVGTPGVGSVLRFTLYALSAMVVFAIGYRLIRYYLETRGRVLVRFRSERETDLWAAARQSAGVGEYTTAAHLLYAALVRTLVLRGALRFHASKTTGDYIRELHQGKQGAVLTQFTDFARVYEAVIYRDGRCDQEWYAALCALAEPVIAPRQAAA